MRLILCAAVLWILIPASGTCAALVLEYQTAASSTNPTLAPSAAASEITATDFSAGSGITAASGGTFNFNGWDSGNASFDGAIGDGDFFRFGFTVTSNVVVDLMDFDIRLDRSGTGPDEFEIQASVNGGAGISLLTFDFMDTDAGVEFLGTSLAAIPELFAGDTIVFTIGAFNSEGAAGTFDLENISGADSRAVRVNGAITAVPEPAGFTFAVFALSFVFRRSRK